ncbi:MAG: glycoside hydrolase family 44 protein [Polyangiaceae bacterium]
MHYLERSASSPEHQTDPASSVFYMSADNEPDLWSSTHSEIHPSRLSRTTSLFRKIPIFAKAIKAAAPASPISLQGPSITAGLVDYKSAGLPDAVTEILLSSTSMKAAEQTVGARLVDDLDVHWYPEAQGDGHRIVDEGVSEGEIQARLQAPRSLWDNTYTGTSWITQYSTNRPIC